MKISDLIEQLYSNNEEEVYIEIGGVLYDFKIGHEEAIFDGFDEFYQASLTLIPIKEEN